MKKVILPLVAAILFSGSAHASEYAAFTKDLVHPYDFYKKSLALTSKKEDAEKAKAAVDGLIETWKPLAALYAADVPKPFAARSDFSKLIMRPIEAGKQAKEHLKSGDVARAHTALEEIRYIMWDLRVKANIISLSDKANDFHEALEVVLDHTNSATTPEEAQRVHARYAAWFLIKWDDMVNASDVASVKESFEPAFTDGRKAVISFLDVLKSGDAAKAQKLAGSVKGAYKKVWMLNNR